jgi:hypothetical protein
MGASQGMQETKQVKLIRTNTRSSYDVKDFKDLYTKG